MEGTIGEIRMFASNFAPRNWWYCDGTIIAIRSNTALFAILGTTYGGDGQTTFALPDLRGRIALGAGQSSTGNVYTLGEKSGSNSVTLNISNLPAHVHTGTLTVTLPAYSESGDKSSPTGNIFASLTNMYSTQTPDVTLKPFAATVTDAATGGNQPIPIAQPWMGMNYVICMTGIFPARD